MGNVKIQVELIGWQMVTAESGVPGTDTATTKPTDFYEIEYAYTIGGYRFQRKSIVQMPGVHWSDVNKQVATVARQWIDEEVAQFMESGRVLLRPNEELTYASDSD